METWRLGDREAPWLLLRVIEIVSGKGGSSGRRPQHKRLAGSQAGFWLSREGYRPRSERDGRDTFFGGRENLQICLPSAA